MKNDFEIQAGLDRLRVLFPNEPDIAYRKARGFLIDFWLQAEGAGYNKGFAEGRKTEPEQWELPARK